ncbi:MAG TPA: EAL domain-containing protein [Steroidobacteraceae bacterium]|jgi:diguanylate cyclase (GGDEF)-like protein
MATTAEPTERAPRNHLTGWLAEPLVLFPAIAVVVIGLIWLATWEVTRSKRADAMQAAAGSTREILDIYRAQVMRAMREIDQAFNTVTYWRASNAAGKLTDLENGDLLPPPLIFVVSLVDKQGHETDTTRSAPGAEELAGTQCFEQTKTLDTVYIQAPVRGPTGERLLHFCKRLTDTSGQFAGEVVISMQASYFVSGYEGTKLGNHGMLALLSADGTKLVGRSGEDVESGGRWDYKPYLVTSDTLDRDVKVWSSTPDRVPRWAAAAQVYGFPVVALAALAVDEQMSGIQPQLARYLWAAMAETLATALLCAYLGHQSWLLARTRRRETEQRLAHAERVEHLAYHDALTGLPNRSMFSRELNRHILEAQRYQRQLAVAFIDLDRFKQINDTLGHEAGDQLLKTVAKRLLTSVRDSDTVARLGGDEFVIMLPQITQANDAAVVAQKVLASIAVPFTLIGQEFRVTASIGIGVFPQHGIDEETLKKNADIAMYQAKAEGKNNYRFYSESLNANSLERLALESSLRHALERNEFRLCYQAKREISSGRIVGTEALLRWESPDLGTVAPMQFIPVAEESGLIIPIGKWILRTACAQNVAWQRAGAPPLNVAINLSPRQFADEGLLRDVQGILQETGLEAHYLEFEISESILIQNVEATLKVLTALKSLGVRIAIDDFGTGYTSLTTLQRFPLDTIKIDQKVVQGIAADDKNAGLTDAVIAMGKNLSLTVVAQGVETSEQAEFLRQHACDELQGFYFNRPMAPEVFGKLLLASVNELTYTGKRLGLAPDEPAA